MQFVLGIFFKNQVEIFDDHILMQNTMLNRTIKRNRCLITNLFKISYKNITNSFAVIIFNIFSLKDIK